MSSLFQTTESRETLRKRFFDPDANALRRVRAVLGLVQSGAPPSSVLQRQTSNGSSSSSTGDPDNNFPSSSSSASVGSGEHMHHNESLSSSSSSSITAHESQSFLVGNYSLVYRCTQQALVQLDKQSSADMVMVVAVVDLMAAVVNAVPEKIRKGWQRFSMTDTITHLLMYENRLEVSLCGIRLLMTLMDVLGDNVPPQLELLFQYCVNYIPFVDPKTSRKLYTHLANEQVNLLVKRRGEWSFCARPRRSDMQQTTLAHFGFLVASQSFPREGDRKATSELQQRRQECVVSLRTIFEFIQAPQRRARFSFWYGMLKRRVFPQLYPTICKGFQFYNNAEGNQVVGFRPDCPPGLHTCVVEWHLICVQHGGEELRAALCNDSDNLKFVMEILRQSFLMPLEYEDVISAVISMYERWLRGEFLTDCMRASLTTFVVAMMDHVYPVLCLHQTPSESLTLAARAVRFFGAVASSDVALACMPVWEHLLVTLVSATNYLIKTMPEQDSLIALIVEACFAVYASPHVSTSAYLWEVLFQQCQAWNGNLTLVTRWRAALKGLTADVLQQRELFGGLSYAVLDGKSGRPGNAEEEGESVKRNRVALRHFRAWNQMLRVLGSPLTFPVATMLAALQGVVDALALIVDSLSLHRHRQALPPTSSSSSASSGGAAVDGGITAGLPDVNSLLKIFAPIFFRICLSPRVLPSVTMGGQQGGPETVQHAGTVFDTAFEAISRLCFTRLGTPPADVYVASLYKTINSGLFSRNEKNRFSVLRHSLALFHCELPANVLLIPAFCHTVLHTELFARDSAAPADVKVAAVRLLDCARHCADQAGVRGNRVLERLPFPATVEGLAETRSDAFTRDGLDKESWRLLVGVLHAHAREAPQVVCAALRVMCVRLSTQLRALRGGHSLESTAVLEGLLAVLRSLRCPHASVGHAALEVLGALEPYIRELQATQWSEGDFEAHMARTDCKEESGVLREEYEANMSLLDLVVKCVAKLGLELVNRMLVICDDGSAVSAQFSSGVAEVLRHSKLVVEIVNCLLAFVVLVPALQVADFDDVRKDGVSAGCRLRIFSLLQLGVSATHAGDEEGIKEDAEAMQPALRRVEDVCEMGLRWMLNNFAECAYAERPGAGEDVFRLYEYGEGEPTAKDKETRVAAESSERSSVHVLISAYCLLTLTEIPSGDDEDCAPLVKVVVRDVTGRYYWFASAMMQGGRCAAESDATTLLSQVEPVQVDAKRGEPQADMLGDILAYIKEHLTSAQRRAEHGASSSTVVSGASLNEQDAKTDSTMRALEGDELDGDIMMESEMGDGSVEGQDAVHHRDDVPRFERMVSVEGEGDLEGEEDEEEEANVLREAAADDPAAAPEECDDEKKQVVVHRSNALSPFCFTRTFLSSLYLTIKALLMAPDQASPRRRIRILRQSPALLASLRGLDNVPPKELHRIGVVFVAKGQVGEDEVLCNGHSADVHYGALLRAMGTLVDMRHHAFYKGGLDARWTGRYSVYHRTHRSEVMFHVVTLMPTVVDDPQQLQKKKQVGNDYVHVVYNSDPTVAYSSATISSRFNHVHIVVSPFGTASDASKQRFQVAIFTKEKVSSDFGPLWHGAVISREQLHLVRITAINANRVVRRSLMSHVRTPVELRRKYFEDTARRFTAKNHSIEAFLAHFFRSGNNNNK